MYSGLSILAIHFCPFPKVELKVTPFTNINNVGVSNNVPVNNHRPKQKPDNITTLEALTAKLKPLRE